MIDYVCSAAYTANCLQIKSTVAAFYINGKPLYIAITASGLRCTTAACTAAVTIATHRKYSL
eukprot:16277-Heterococcus_DN1.PRE.5